MSRSTDDGREHSPGGVVAGKSSFAHPWSIIHNQSRYISIISHIVWELKSGP